MKANDRNIYQLRAYLQVQRILNLFLLMSYVKVLKEAVETVASSGLRVTGSNEPETLFMQLSALQGSILENRIFEDDFQVESISTAKLFQLVNSQPATEILTIDSANIDTILPTLPFADNIKEDIRNTVNQNLIIRIPQSEIVYEDWIGRGYIKEDPETGESGFMLSGMLASHSPDLSGVAGGMTAWGLDKWPEYYLERLINPYSEPPNYDPTSAAYIQKITYTDMQKGTVGTELAEPLQVLVHDNTMKPVKGAEVTFTVKAGGGRFSNGQTSITVKTNYQGIAFVGLILGKYTKDNPTFWWEAGYTYSQQIGENIVNAALPSGTSITVPFTAYGFPKEPDHINKTFGDGQMGAILSFAGFVSLSIEDEYDNPISNQGVELTVLPPADRSSCPNPNKDTRQAYLLKTEEPCIKDAPVWGECGDTGAQTLDVFTSPEGAAVEVILGGVPDAEYPIEATAGQLKEVFHLYTNVFGNCDGMSEPSAQLVLQYIYPADRYGNNVNAGRPGTEIPVMARMYYLREGEEEKDETLSCSDGTVTCPRIAGSRQYYVDTEFTEATVTFSGIEGTPQGKGIYTAIYTLSPGLNRIEIEGRAGITQRRSILSCTGCSTTTETITRSSVATLEVYGVDIQTEPVPVILVDGNGYAKQDYTINYTITPSGYKAMTAYVMIYKDKSIDPIVAIPTETSGQGRAAISKGFQFDANSAYEAEVILNYGTGVEIRSARVQIPIAEIRVLNDKVFEPNNVKEIKFGDGSRIEKRYHIELVSKALTEACDNDKLTGKIMVMDKDGKTIKPETDYYPSEHLLKFEQSGGKCIVRINDETSGLIKDRFIISNLSRIALENRLLELQEKGISVDLTKIAVLYGGIGNEVEIEINGARKEVPIEPVGVIVLGIDGLRQDVLYGPEEASYSDPQGCGGWSCYIDKVNLPGLSQILTDKGTVKLKNVTAIFPSITLASWASIFTGKMPKDTGILGNEFFARDLNMNVPERFDKPEGIISFGSGAFRGYDDVFPKASDFFIPYQANWAETVSTEGTPQNNPEILKPQTVYEAITAMSGVGKYFDAKGGDPAVVANSHYSRGAYWLTWDIEFGCVLAWTCPSETLDQASWDKLDDYLSGRYRSGLPGFKERNELPFSALTVWYLPGLDHEAHGKGMRVYREYFTSITDKYIRKVVNRLKELGEFDNKIFIITADHGHTAMPHNYTVDITDPETGQTRSVTPDTSCKLKLKHFDRKDIQEPELANNNLHIWELGEVLKAVGKFTRGSFSYKVLAPQSIATLYSEEEYGARSVLPDANVIAAFNGPMAHIYVTNLADTGKVAEIFRLLMQSEYLSEAIQWFNITDKGYKDLRSIVGGMNLKSSIDKILVRVSGNYCIFDGLNNDGSPKCADTDPFSATEYVDAWTRINGMNHKDRSGDIVLIMKDATSGDATDRYTTGSACKSWHGSLNRSDSYVPFIIAYPGGNKNELEKALQRDTLCKMDYSNCKGNWKLTDIVKGIISEQYK